MHLKSFIFLASASFLSSLTNVAASPLTTSTNPLSQLPGYPYSLNWCLTDDQAKFIANAFKTILTSQDRNLTKTTAERLLANDYVEYSDSINSLAGHPLQTATFPSKTVFIQQVVPQPAIPTMTTLDVFHDCNKITWRWTANGLALATYPVNGISVFQVNNPGSGQIDRAYIEFNSIAWGVDVGGSYERSAARG